MLVSIVIRTYNEQRHLSQLLDAIHCHNNSQIEYEIIIVDSGSTDNTVNIAKKYSCNILSIPKKEFSFGRSLNIGCKSAKGDFLVFISGHCVPVQSDWIENIIAPIINNQAVYTYGRQIGDHTSKFSEYQLFLKYYPEVSRLQYGDFFINNANACLKREIWEKYQFDEQLTGLEDMELAKRLINDGYRIYYVAEAPVYHYHHETWGAVKRRYERESIALQYIMPEIHISLSDFLRYFISGIFYDVSVAIQKKMFWKRIVEIVLFRLMQYWGSYRGNHRHRQLSKRKKELYFYPKNKN